MKTFLKTIFIAMVMTAVLSGQSVLAETFTYQPTGINYYSQPQVYPAAPVYYQNTQPAYDTERIQQLLALLASLQAQLLQLQQSQGIYTAPQQVYPYNQYDPYTYPYGYIDPYAYNQSDMIPDVTIDKARSVSSYSAKLEGEVDMRDYRNGLVFFVYGQDKNAIEDVQDDYDQYDDVLDDEDYGEFMIVRVDNDLDGDDDYSETVDNLDYDEKYYFTLCVEYEDNNRDEVLECGSTKNFTTN